MKNPNNEAEGGCPFKRLNNRLQIKTKKGMIDVLKNKQIAKHKEYVEIIRNSFQGNKEYFIHIGEHIKQIDKDAFTLQDDSDGDSTRLCQFLNVAIKKYFFEGMIFGKHSPSRELQLQHIGDLGLNDVTTILKHLLYDHTLSLEEVLEKLDKEIDIRLGNNVLIDSVLHLDDFPHPIVSKQKEQSAKSIFDILETRFDKDTNRFATDIVAPEFREPMREDEMIDDHGVVPQLTFGCPVANINRGEIFRTFVTMFVHSFLVESKRFGTDI